MNSENRYNRILARKDGRRPQFCSELAAEWARLGLADGLVLRSYILLPNGATVDCRWSEQSANAERERAKGKE